MGNLCSSLNDEDSLEHFDSSVIAVADMGCGEAWMSSGANQSQQGDSDAATSSSSSSNNEKRSWNFSYRYAIYLALLCVLIGTLRRFYSGPSTLEAMLLESSLTITTNDERKINDHMYVELDQLSLTPKQLQLVKDVYKSPKLNTKQIQADATAVGVKISPHLVYRYFKSSEWDKGR